VGEYYVESEAKIVSENGTEFFFQAHSMSHGWVKPHIHTAVEMLYITAGSFQIFAENIEYTLSAGEAILFRSHTLHRVRALEEGSGYYVLKWHPSFILGISSAENGAAYLLKLAQRRETAKVAWSRAECEKNGIAAGMARLSREWDGQAYGADIAIKAAAAELLLFLLRDMAGAHETREEGSMPREQLTRRIYDVTVYIHKHYAEELTAEECARRAVMSYSYFSRSFKRLTGKSFKNYLAAVRIDHAEKALLATERPITEIATACGFNSVAYFSATYKALKGMTPSEARAVGRRMEA
jgi:AraC-like DNA-binding protein